jgi:hypothetical protein
MKIDANRILIVVSSCPSTEERRWNPDNGLTPNVCSRSLLVKIIPETGRASKVFRLEDEMATYTRGEGNPYALYGRHAEAFTGVSKYSLTITVARNTSGDLWNWWDGKLTGNDILKRTKYHGKLKPVPLRGSGPRAFVVYDENGKETDKVFYSRSETIDCEDVRRALITHDGYSEGITVKEEV